MNERIVRCPRIEMWKFQIQKGKQAILLTLGIIVSCCLRQEIIYLLAWVIVCSFLKGPSTTSILANNNPTPFHFKIIINEALGQACIKKS